MKLSLSKLFDADAVIKSFTDAKVVGIEDFVSSVSDLSDRLIQMLRNNVSLGDNVDCTIKDLILTHNKSIVIDNPNRLKQVRHMVATKALPFVTPLTSLAWQYNGNGSLEIKAQFLGAPTTPVITTLVMYY